MAHSVTPAPYYAIIRYAAESHIGSGPSGSPKPPRYLRPPTIVESNQTVLDAIKLYLRFHYSLLILWHLIRWFFVLFKSNQIKIKSN